MAILKTTKFAVAAISVLYTLVLLLDRAARESVEYGGEINIKWSGALSVWVTVANWALFFAWLGVFVWSFSLQGLAKGQVRAVVGLAPLIIAILSVLQKY